jgi:hypothetical protein
MAQVGTCVACEVPNVRVATATKRPWRRGARAVLALGHALSSPRGQSLWRSGTPGIRRGLVHGPALAKVTFLAK